MSEQSAVRAQTTPGRVIFNSEVKRSLLESVDDGKEIELPEFINQTLAKRETAGAGWLPEICINAA